jgi:hypothetical protein
MIKRWPKTSAFCHLTSDILVFNDGALYLMWSEFNRNLESSGSLLGMHSPAAAEGAGNCHTGSSAKPAGIFSAGRAAGWARGCEVPGLYEPLPHTWKWNRVLRFAPQPKRSSGGGYVYQWQTLLVSWSAADQLRSRPGLCRRNRLRFSPICL